MKSIITLANINLFALFTIFNTISIAQDNYITTSLSEQGKSSWGKTSVRDYSNIDTVEIQLVKTSTVTEDLNSGVMTRCLLPSNGPSICSINLVDQEQIPTYYEMKKEAASYKFEGVDALSTMTFNVRDPQNDTGEYLCGAIIFGNTGLIVSDNRELECMPTNDVVIDNKLIITFDITLNDDQV